jgi:hypothetical protein
MRGVWVLTVSPPQANGIKANMKTAHIITQLRRLGKIMCVLTFKWRHARMCRESL